MYLFHSISFGKKKNSKWIEIAFVMAQIENLTVKNCSIKWGKLNNFLYLYIVKCTEHNKFAISFELNKKNEMFLEKSFTITSFGVVRVLFFAFFFGQWMAIINRMK